MAEVTLGVDPDQLVRAASYHSCRVALAEATISMVGESVLLPYDPSDVTVDVQQTYVRVGGNSASRPTWTISQMRYAIPQRVVLAPSLSGGNDEALADPDIYILRTGLHGAHADVEEALRDALSCFRQGLYRPAVAMLAKAMEGAWIELGVALARTGHSPPGQEPETFIDWLQSDNSVAAKIDRVIGTYSDIPRQDPIRKGSHVSPAILRNAALWSHTLRVTRNAIHFGVAPTIAYDYTGVAVLLMAAAIQMPLIYSVKQVAATREIGNDA